MAKNTSTGGRTCTRPAAGTAAAAAAAAAVAVEEGREAGGDLSGTLPFSPPPPDQVLCPRCSHHTSAQGGGASVLLRAPLLPVLGRVH